MSSRLFLLLSIVFSFLQGPFLPVVFTEGTLIIFLVLSRPSLKIAPVIAISGLFFDFIQNQKLGETSLLFLFSMLVLYLTRERLQIQKALTLSIAALALNALRWKIIFGFSAVFPLLASFLASFVLLYFLWHPVKEGKIRV